VANLFSDINYDNNGATNSNGVQYMNILLQTNFKLKLEKLTAKHIWIYAPVSVYY